MTAMPEYGQRKVGWSARWANIKAQYLLWNGTRKATTFLVQVWIKQPSYGMHSQESASNSSPSIQVRATNNWLVTQMAVTHYSKKLEEQTFDKWFFSLVRTLDILGVARWNRCSCWLRTVYCDLLTFHLATPKYLVFLPDWKILCQKFVPLNFWE